MLKRSTLLARVLIVLTFLFGTSLQKLSAQSGNEFWLAPPDVTDLHNPPGGEPLYLLVSSMGQAATVTITQPANPGFNGGVPIVVNLAAGRSSRVNLTPFKAALETRPTNTILNTGLRIQSTTPITSYYEVANTNNTDIWALKGPNGLGMEFYIPLHKHAPFFNHTFASPHQAFASFDIVATQNNTIVTIYSPVPVDGHPALQQFSVTLNMGQTYSCGFTGTNYEQPSTHPSGAVVLADKPVAVSLKDDSDQNPSGGCYDLMGDQLVPVSVVGEDYIAVKGSLNNTGDESVVIVATQNNTQIFLDGAVVPVVTLFAGEYYRVDMDYLAPGPNNAVYVHATHPIYAVHITGFGCEMGQALLPPLNCAGSRQVNFVRSSTENFYLTLLVRSTAVNNFTITGPGTATINPASFLVVPGTGGTWRAARVLYNTTQIPVDSTFSVTNSADVFALGIINGGATSGCRYGYFSEFVAPITVNAGTDQTVCANSTALLAGQVAGGTTTGQWTSSGTGSFTPNNTTLNATYTPSSADAAVGTVTLTLTSTGACIPQSDTKILTITPAPTANAGPDVSVCRNNANVSLNGAVTIASGGVWTGGAGTFIPGNNVLNPVYVPTAGELSAGSLALTLTTTGNGICNPVSDNILITFTPAPTVNAGADQTKCGNNAATTLSGSITVATGGVWTGGSGSFTPSPTALNAVYTPSPAEISAGSVTLTLTSTGNGTCNSVSDQMTIFFTLPPTANAGPDQVKCANNAATALAGSVTGSTGGQWSGGLGTFSPNNNTLTATYTPTAGEIASGSVTLTLTTTGNGTCNAVTDQVLITFTAAPTVNAGPDQTVCANNPGATLAGSFTVASGALWSGAGTFSPNNTTMNAVYTPTPAQIAAGTATVTLTTTGNGTCNAVNDQVVITITPAPTVNAGPNQTVCANNPNITLAGTFTVASGAAWSGGTGTYSPNNTSMNAVYTPSAAEISAGTVTLTLTTTGNGTCNAVNDQVVFTITPSPTANAGSDQTVCGNNAMVTLGGSVTIASGGQWSGGLGVFAPNNSTLNASYTPTAGEIAAGSVTLTLTTTGNGTCNAVTDQMTIFFTPAPTVNAGPDQTVCANNPNVTLAGAFTVSGGAVWTGGSGSFSPNNTTMNAVYTPTPAEITAGTVTLLLTSTGNGGCLPVSDQMTITITSSPIVNAGTNISACANSASTALSGTVFNATGGTWSGGSGTYNPNANTLNAIYTPSAAEIAAGIVTLTLTSTGNGSCNPVTDQVTITYAPSPVANAGANQTVCANNAVISLNGFVNFCAGGQWSGGLGTFTPNNNALGATYIPTAGEIAAGSLDLILTTTGNGSCNPVRDTMTIIFTPAPTVDAGAAQTSCANSPAVTLNGSFTVSSGAVWSGGGGSYSPGTTAMNAVYTPSAAEIAAGTVTLFLTSTGNGSCLPVMDSVIISIVPSPLVNAGTNQTTCVTNLNVALSGSVSGFTNTGQWSTLGSGTFSPSNTALNASYSCSTADSAAGTVTLILTSTNNASCAAVHDTMVISILPAGTAAAGADQTVCANNATVNLAGVVGGGANSGTWSTTGTGIFLPNNSTLNASYIPSAFDIAQGGATLFLTANSCNPAVDSLSLTITPAPVVMAGPDQTVCASSPNATLSGSVSGGTTTGIWTTSGSGSFSPSNTTPGATYIPSGADIATQNLVLILTSTNNGSCVPVSDTMLLHIYPTGTANAGPDQVICSNNPNVVLAGVISGGASSGQWSSTGTGIFLPNDTTLNATYVPSSADIASGAVNLILTATNSCNSAIDFMTVLFTPAPAADAGPNQAICGLNPVINLSGAVTNATGGTWSGGSGTYNPNNTTLSASYSPSAAEIAAGGVLLTLTTTGNGNCNASSDTVYFALTSSIFVNAGVDQQVCISSATTQLQGIVSNGSTSGVWNTLGSGIFLPNDSALNALYQFSMADTAAGLVTLILTSTNNGNCPSVQDTMNITFGPSAFAWAGNDQQICADNPVIQLNGLATGGATAGVWTTSGSGSFAPTDSVLNAVYTLSSADISAGSVFLYITTTDHGSCLPGFDSMMVTVTPVSVVTAGGDVTVCSSNMSVTLGGSVSGASSTGIWTTNGSGSFVPDNLALNATYMPSASDSLNGTVTLALTATGTNVCAPASDTMVITITPAAVVSAGNDQQVCALTASVPLNGSVSVGSTTGQWSSMGSGTFTPNNTTLNAAYVPSPSDIAAGTVTLVLTSTNNGICAAETDSVTISFQGVATVVAGSDQVICGSANTVTLNGQVSGISTTGAWTTMGSGTFSPGNTTLNAIYTLSNADIVAGGTQLVLTSTNNGLCPAFTDTMNITVEPVPIAAFIYDNSNPPAVVFADQSGNAASWYWTFGDGGSSTSQNPTHTYGTSGDYNVLLIVTSAGGCTDSSFAVVPVTEDEVLPPAVPTGFTPNSDGKNDVLHVLGGPYKEVAFRIFNEWGNEVFSTTDPAQGWDGTYKGKPQPGGVYIYTVTGTTIEDKPVVLSGNVTLIR